MIALSRFFTALRTHCAFAGSEETDVPLDEDVERTLLASLLLCFDELELELEIEELLD